MPPPSVPELPEKVLEVMVTVAGPSARMAPPSSVAALFDRVLEVMVIVEAPVA